MNALAEPFTDTKPETRIVDFGVSGMIPAPECVDRQIALYTAFTEGNDEEMERVYREMLPVIVFCMPALP